MTIRKLSTLMSEQEAINKEMKVASLIESFKQEKGDFKIIAVNPNWRDLAPVIYYLDSNGDQQIALLVESIICGRVWADLYAEKVEEVK